MDADQNNEPRRPELEARERAEAIADIRAGLEALKRGEARPVNGSFCRTVAKVRDPD
jgi:hypothetical protein